MKNESIVLAKIGSYVLTLNGLGVLLAAAGLFAYLRLFRFRSEKGQKIMPLILISSLLTGTAAGLIWHLLFDKVPVFGGYDHILFVMGMFAGLFIPAKGRVSAVQKLLSECVPAYIAFACLVSLIEQDYSGVVLEGKRFFSYPAGQGLYRAAVGAAQGTVCLIVLLMCEMPLHFDRVSAKFPRRPLALLSLCAACFLPLEILRDSVQPRLLGIRIDALLLHFALIAILMYDSLTRTEGGRLTGKQRFLSSLIPVFPVLLSMVCFALGSLIFCLIFSVSGVIVAYSPLFPFLKPPVRAQQNRKRRFTD